MTDRDRERFNTERALPPPVFFPHHMTPPPDCIQAISSEQVTANAALRAGAAKLLVAAREVLRCYHPGSIAPSQMAPGMTCNAAMDALSAAVEALDPTPPRHRRT